MNGEDGQMRVRELKERIGVYKGQGLVGERVYSVPPTITQNSMCNMPWKSIQWPYISW